MIFSELYSAYYNTVAKIIGKILDGERNEKELQKAVCENAFDESVLTILPSLKSEKWQLVHKDFTTPLTHKPTMPLTALQKSWLKAISLDARIKLFDFPIEGLDGVEPLFTDKDFYVYDKCADSDPYGDEEYIKRFRFILSAIKRKAPINIKIVNRRGRPLSAKCLPVRLEYSEKDDKFRLITSGSRNVSTVNLARITECSEYYGDYTESKKDYEARYKTVTLEITDERNALERCMLHFAHFEKQAQRLDEKRYLVHIKYDCGDESEIIVRILSFGPLVRVSEPQSVVQLIKERLIRQKDLNLK